MKRTLIFLLAILMCLPIFASCTGESGNKNPTGTTVDGADKTTAKQGEEDVPEVILNLVKNGEAQCKIVCKSKDNASLNAGQLLADKIEYHLSAKMKMAVDELEDYNADTVEILVGLTNRPESKKAYESAYHEKDYFVGVIGNKLVILATGEKTIDSAVNWFFNKYIAKNKRGSKNPLNVSSKDNYTFLYDYNVSSLTLMGTPATKFSITYPKGNPKSELLYAYLIHDYLLDKAGIDLPIKEASGKADEYEIAVGGGTAEPGKAKVVADGNHLNISGNDFLDYEDLYYFLTENLFKGTLKVRDISVASDYTYTLDANIHRAKAGDYRVIFHNIWGLSDKQGDGLLKVRAKMLVEYYRVYAPDVIGFNEFWPTIVKGTTLKADILGLGYKEAVDPTTLALHQSNDVNVVPVFYNPDRLEVVDSKWIDFDNAGNANDDSKCATVIVFKDKSTGKQFITVALHLSAAENDTVEKQFEANERRLENIEILHNKLMTFIASYGELPIILGGDHNADYTDFCTDGKYNYSDVILSTINSKTPHDYRRAGALLQIQTLGRTQTCSGYRHAVDLAVTKYPAGSCQGYPIYNTTYGISTPCSLPARSTVATKAMAMGIDHCYVWNSEKVTIDTYSIMNGIYTRSLSDHNPQIVDFTLK